MTARNAPCPCGSGRKFKRCCGRNSDARPDARLRAFEFLSEQLFLERFKEHREHGERDFLGGWVDVLVSRDAPPVLGTESTRIGLLCYIALDRELPGTDRSMLGDVLQRLGRRLESGVRRTLTVLAGARLGLYEVREVSPEGRLRCAPLEPGAEEVIADAAPVLQQLRVPVEPGDVFAARLVRDSFDRPSFTGEMYAYRSAFRERVLQRLQDLEPGRLDGSVCFQLWVEDQLDRYAPHLRPKTAYPHLAADLRDYLDGDDLSLDLPKERRTIGLYLGRIVVPVSGVSNREVDTQVPCRRRPGSRPCRGTVRARKDEEGRVEWVCPRCGDSGNVTGWEATPFDLRDRDVHARTGAHSTKTCVLTIVPADYRRLLGLIHLTAPAIALIVAAGAGEDGGVNLQGTPQEVAALARCVAVHFGHARPLASADALERLHVGLAALAEIPADLSAAAQCAEILLYERSRRRRLRLASGSTYRVRVDLLDIDPPIWRRLDVPSTYSLEDLYETLILAFGWSNTHLHLFELDGRRFGQPSDEWYFEVEDERRVRVSDVLPGAGSRIIWEYDLGDSWRHEIVVEEVLPEPVARPRLIDGERAAPPEDCGGPPGYEDLLDALSNPFHEAHQEMCEWAGGYDPGAFDRERLSERISRLESAESFDPNATGAPRP